MRGKRLFQDKPRNLFAKRAYVAEQPNRIYGMLGKEL